MARCDFCGTEKPSWRYPCQDFDMAEIAPWGSVGDFAACEVCSYLSSSTKGVGSWLSAL